MKKLFTVTFEALKIVHPSKPPVLAVGETSVLADSFEEAINVALQREALITRIFHTVTAPIAN